MRLRLTFFVMFAFVVSLTTFAQFGPVASDGLSASGETVIKVRPEFLQLSVQVEGRSSDLPQAVEELRRRMKAAEKKLQDLDAIAASIVIAKPKIQGASSPEQTQQMRAMMQQYGGGSRGQKMLEKTMSVSITQTVTARWLLPDEDDLSRLVATKELTEKIRQADVASVGDKQPVSPAQEELAVEMEAMMEDYSYGEEKTKSGEPTFRFVATISAEQFKSAVANAFANAQREIRTLAEATETEIGEPVPLNVNIGSTAAANYYGRATTPGPTHDAETGDYELTADDPIEATCTVTVAAFAKHN